SRIPFGTNSVSGTIGGDFKATFTQALPKSSRWGPICEGSASAYWIHNGLAALQGDYSASNFETDLLLGPAMSVVGAPLAIGSWIYSMNDPVGEAKAMGVRMAETAGVPTSTTDAVITVLAGPVAGPVKL